MPRYFFDARDGSDILDKVGVDLPGINEARVHAVQFAGQLLCDNAVKFWQGEEWVVEARDETGLILFSLMFIANSSAATRHIPPPT